MNRFTHLVDTYLRLFSGEIGRLTQFKTFLTNTNTVADLISRTRFEGHTTASAIVIWRSKHKVLMMRHKDLPEHYQYYQPGGHFKEITETPLDVARRKIEEGLPCGSCRYFPLDTDELVPIDIDSHFIPEMDAVKEAKHYHHDFRYLFFIDETRPVPELPAGWRWEDLNELGRQNSLSHLIPKIRQTLAEDRPRSFFEHILETQGQFSKISCVAVIHMIPDVLPYVRALGRFFDLVGVIPKPKSINSATEKQVEPGCRICRMTREEINAGSTLFTLLSNITGKFVLLDIGGYFSNVVGKISEQAGERFLGIVEDTENGHQRYKQLAEQNGLAVPVFSVARSPLKDNEDFLVGQSIVFSADFVLRNVGHLIQYLQCAVFGYGKIGSSIAHHLLLRGMKPWVFDTNPIKRARAVTDLCKAPLRTQIVKHADVIFSATGSHALNIHDLRSLKSGCFVISVTSSDDEMDLSFLAGEYTADKVTNHVTKYSSFTNYFYLVNEGNAVNFIHDAVLGDAIHMVRGEILLAARALHEKKVSPGLHELSESDRKMVVSKWLNVFVDYQQLTTG